MSKLARAFETIDQFGIGVQFNIKQRNKLGSITGGIVTIFYILIVLAYGV
jgi:hypothetical protein